MKRIICVIWCAIIVSALSPSTLAARQPPQKLGGVGGPEVLETKQVGGTVDPVNPSFNLKEFFCPAKFDANQPVERANDSFCNGVILPDVRDNPMPITVQGYNATEAINNILLMQGLPLGFAMNRHILAKLLSNPKLYGVETTGKMNIVYVIDHEDKIWTVFFYRKGGTERWVVQGYRDPMGSIPKGASVYIRY